MNIVFTNEKTNDTIEFYFAEDYQQAIKFLTESTEIIESAINQDITICIKK